MLKHLDSIQNIKSTIASVKNILAITHQKPDGDGLGALSALACYLEFLGKEYQLFCLDDVPETNQFLPLIYQVTSDQAIFLEHFDLIIVLDSGDLKYAGVENLIKNINYKFTLVNIDHHQTNNNFGDLNLVLPDKSSVSEIIYNLFRFWQFPITKDVATALLNGIIFDTGAFSNGATTLSALEAASHLLNLGARHKEITQNQIKNKGLGILKLWGRAFERLVYNKKFDLAYTVVTRKDFQECEAPAESATGISNFLNELAGAKISLVLKEGENGEISGSLRTTYDDINVGKLAQALGGGGHKKAAGFSLKGQLRYNNNHWEII